MLHGSMMSDTSPLCQASRRRLPKPESLIAVLLKALAGPGKAANRSLFPAGW